jgi:hypothetical protein
MFLQSYLITLSSSILVCLEIIEHYIQNHITRGPIESVIKHGHLNLNMTAMHGHLNLNMTAMHGHLNLNMTAKTWPS